MGENFEGLGGLLLARPHGGVMAVLGQQRRMVTAFDNVPGVKHDDLIGIDHRRQAVGNDQGGAPGRNLAQRFLDFLLRMGIQRRGGFVEQQDAGLFENGPGNGDPLLFAAGQLQAPFTDHGLVTVRLVHDEIMDAGQLGRFLHFRRGCLRVAVGDVVIDRIVEQHRILRYDADGGA